MQITTHNPPTVSVGSHVQIRDVESNERESYTLTRPGEADIRRHCISTLSPMGKALYGKSPGDIVEVDAPGGLLLVEVEAVEHVPSWEFVQQ